MKKIGYLALALMLCFALALPAAAADDAEKESIRLSGICADGGALLATDVYNKVLYRLEGGKLTRAAGVIGAADVAGEPIGAYRDGAADQAYFMEPWAVVPLGDGYAISDAGAHVVRYFAKGRVQTLAGTGKEGTADGAAKEASFSRPTGLAAGSDGTLYVADTGSGAIRGIGTDGKVKTVVSGLTAPTGLCWRDGVLYVAETGRSRILRVVDGKAETLAGSSTPAEDAGEYYGGYVDGPVASAKFDHPQGVAVGADGTVYVADTGNSVVRAIRSGRVYTILRAGTGETLPSQPRGLLVRGDTLYIADMAAQEPLTVSLAGKSYSDVVSGAWYVSAIESAVRNGIASGTSETTFEPDAKMNRAMFVTMLSRVHRISDGAIIIDGDATFADVPENEWFAPAVRWAADNGISGGDGEGFAPMRSISREELAAMLYRYAKSQGMNAAFSANALDAFPDAGRVSSWAREAMCWACSKGVIGGDDEGRLNPGASATRAQALTMLLRFMEAYSL